MTDFQRAAAMVAGASAVFAAMGVCIKLAAQTLNNEMLVFLRNVFGLLFLLPWLLKLRLAGLATRRLRLHLLRAAAGLTAMYCFFYCIARLHLSDAVLLNYSVPLFTPLIAGLWLGERITGRIVGAIVVGFIGIALVLKPGQSGLSLVTLAGVAAGFFAAVALTTIRRMSDTEPAPRVVFWFALFSLLFSGLPLPWQWQTPGSDALGLMVLAGALATAGQLLITRGYSLAPASQVGVFVYTSVLWAALGGWLVWDEQPDAGTAAGALLIIGAGVMVSRQAGQVPNDRSPR